MFSIPQPGTPKPENCLVIPLDDSRDDLCALLNALYNGLSLHSGNQITLDFSLSVLRLSDKYGMEDLRNGIVELLKDQWPLNRSDYLTYQKLFGSPGFRIVESMKLIAAARLCNAPELLPTAFYELAASRIRDWSDSQRDMSHHCLSSIDLSCLVVGRERLLQRLSILASWDIHGGALPNMWYPDADAPITIFAEKLACNCDTYKHGYMYCNRLFETLANNISTNVLRGEWGLDALEKLSQLRPPGACSNCISWFHGLLTNKAKEVWENIPTDFDLPKVDPQEYAKSRFQPF
ncbi:hypothetical protein K439DRAFT_259464 [Ramaria rubella]|nr:hypothetical protein K439DRAFT_259464 [Ramaria rubella]